MSNENETLSLGITVNTTSTATIATIKQQGKEDFTRTFPAGTTKQEALVAVITELHG
jgi:hypothetical protein